MNVGVHLERPKRYLFSSIIASTSVCLSSSGVLAQGTLNFSTLVTGAVDARVSRGNSLADAVPVGADYFGQLYVGKSDTDLTAVGHPIAFIDAPSGGRGYIRDGEVVVPGLPPGFIATVELRAWRRDLGITYEAAASQSEGFYSASSDPIIVTLGPLGDGHTSSFLIGLSSFLIPIPEPDCVSLIAMGALVLWVRQSAGSGARALRPRAVEPCAHPNRLRPADRD